METIHDREGLSRLSRKVTNRLAFLNQLHPLHSPLQRSASHTAAQRPSRITKPLSRTNSPKSRIASTVHRARFSDPASLPRPANCSTSFPLKLVTANPLLPARPMTWHVSDNYRMHDPTSYPFTTIDFESIPHETAWQTTQADFFSPTPVPGAVTLMTSPDQFPMSTGQERFSAPSQHSSLSQRGVNLHDLANLSGSVLNTARLPFSDPPTDQHSVPLPYRNSNQRLGCQNYVKEDDLFPMSPIVPAWEAEAIDHAAEIEGDLVGLGLYDDVSERETTKQTRPCILFNSSPRKSLRLEQEWQPSTEEGDESGLETDADLDADSSLNYLDDAYRSSQSFQEDYDATCGFQYPYFGMGNYDQTGLWYPMPHLMYTDAYADPFYRSRSQAGQMPLV